MMRLLRYPSEAAVDTEILLAAQKETKGYTSEHKHNASICNTTDKAIRKEFDYVYKQHGLRK